MTENFCCTICQKNYQTKNGLYKHNIKYHPINSDKLKDYKCEFCARVFKSRQSRWYHAQSCKQKHQTFEEKLNQLSEKVNILEKKPQKIINNTTNNDNSNTTTNILNNYNTPLIDFMTTSLVKETLELLQFLLFLIILEVLVFKVFL